MVHDNDRMFTRDTLPRLARVAALALVLAAPGVQAAPAWFEGSRPSAQAHEAVQLLADAASHGLATRDYGVESLRTAIENAARDPAPTRDGIERIERQLQDAMVLYLTHLHRGRVDPRRVHHDFAPARGDPYDARLALDDALTHGRLHEAVSAATPRIPMYEALRGFLRHYRALEADPAWQSALPPLTHKLEAGQAYAGLDLLARRLLALGDLAAIPAHGQRYDGLLVEAVRQFQGRHALAVDGVIGRATLAQLQVTPAERARQIELALERLRWTPLLQGPRMIVINIPEYVLRAYEVVDGRIRVQREMKVIVGKALDTRTPLFDEDMRFIEFSPYWNVPPSIARGETVPKLRRDPAEFDRQGYEFVAPDGQVLTTLSSARLDALLAGQLRIRQRPGPRNALGDIKFVFPNRSNIYLHHTPSTLLFERDRRDLSHGCIRVEQPVALATFVLQDKPEWPQERIRQSMSAGKSSTIRLDAPIPVLIAYGTVLVKQGRIFFFDDIYGLDRVLDTALRQSAMTHRAPN